MDPPSAALLPSKISNLSLLDPSQQPSHSQPQHQPRILSKFDPSKAGLPSKPPPSSSQLSSSRSPNRPTGGGGGGLLKQAMSGAIMSSAAERFGPSAGGGGTNNNQHRPQSSNFQPQQQHSSHHHQQQHTAQGIHGPAHATHLRAVASSLGASSSTAQARGLQSGGGAGGPPKVDIGKYDGGFEADERERVDGKGARGGSGEEGGVMMGKVKELELNSGEDGGGLR